MKGLQEFDEVGMWECPTHGTWGGHFKSQCPGCIIKKGANSMEEKRKKLDYSLLPAEPLESAVKVLMFGAKKHSGNGWKDYPDPKYYQNAVERHMAEIKKGNLFDKETGESHYAHMICSLMFLEWHRLKQDKP